MTPDVSKLRCICYLPGPQSLQVVAYPSSLNQILPLASSLMQNLMLRLFPIQNRQAQQYRLVLRRESSVVSRRVYVVSEDEAVATAYYPCFICAFG